MTSLTPNGVPKIPVTNVPFRDQLEDNAVKTLLKENGVSTLFEQVFDIIDQVPPLMEEVRTQNISTHILYHMNTYIFLKKKHIYCHSL